MSRILRPISMSKELYIPMHKVMTSRDERCGMGCNVSWTRFLPITSWIWQWNGKDSEMIPLVNHSHWMWVCWGKNGNKAKPHVSRCFWNNKRSWMQIWRRWQLQWQSVMLKFLDWTSYCSRPNTGTRLGWDSSQRKYWFEGTSPCLDCWIQKSHRWSEGHDQKIAICSWN